MAIEHAILVSLSWSSRAPGYELARRFDRSIGYFWTATHQQIYRVLKRFMEADGWVEVREVAQQKRGRTSGSTPSPGPAGPPRPSPPGSTSRSSPTASEHRARP